MKVICPEGAGNAFWRALAKTKLGAQPSLLFKKTLDNFLSPVIS